MLLWLQKLKLPKSSILWAKVVAISSCMHLILLSTMFFIYKGDSFGYNIEVNSTILQSDALVVFMPLQKTVRNQQSKKSAQKKNVASKQVAEPKKIIEQKKPDNGTTVMASLEKKAPKPIEKKSKKKQDQKKEQPKVEPKPELKKEEIIVKKAEPEKSPEPVSKENSTQQDEEAPIIYVGRADLDAMHMQEYISQEVVQHWKPPMGMPKDKACQLTIIVGWDGNLRDISMEQSSGAAMYDVSARAAVLAMTFPKWLWGKQFTITFKQ